MLCFYQDITHNKTNGIKMEWRDTPMTKWRDLFHVVNYKMSMHVRIIAQKPYLITNLKNVVKYQQQRRILA